MIVKINEDYQIKVSGYSNNILLKVVKDDSGAIKVNKDKLPASRVIGYYPNIKSAVETAIHLMLEDEFDTLEMVQYLDELERKENEFKELLSEHIH